MFLFCLLGYFPVVQSFFVKPSLNLGCFKNNFNEFYVVATYKGKKQDIKENNLFTPWLLNCLQVI